MDASPKFQGDLERQANIAAGRAYFAAHPDQRPVAQPTPAQAAPGVPVSKFDQTLISLTQRMRESMPAVYEINPRAADIEKTTGSMRNIALGQPDVAAAGGEASGLISGAVSKVKELLGDAAQGAPPATGAVEGAEPAESGTAIEGESTSAPATEGAAKTAGEVPHTMPDLVAEARRTPFTPEKVRSIELTQMEEGHALPKTPLDAVDHIRMHQYATDQVGQFLDSIKLARETGNPEAAAESERLMKQIAEETRPVYQAMAHQAGLGLRVYGKPVSESTPMLNQVWKAIAESNGDLDQMTKAVAALPSAAEAQEFLRVAGNQERGYGGSLASYYTHALLSVNTIAKKVATDGFMMAFGPVQRATAEVMSGMARAVGVAPEKTVAPGEAHAMLMGYKAASAEALTLGWRSMQKNVSQLDPEIWGPAGYHDPAEQGLSSLNVPVLGKALTLYGHMVDLPGRAILGVDNFAKVMQQRAYMHAAAWREAYWTATKEGLTGDAFAQRVQDEYERGVQQPSTNIMESSIADARRATMTAPLTEQGVIGEKLDWIGKSLHGDPLGQVLLPFYNTPMNIAFQGLEFGGPLGAASKVMRDQLLSNTPERYTAAAKMALSTAMIYAVWDHIHGGAPENAQVKKLTESEEHHQPYSITIGDHEVGNIPAPLDNTLGLLADGKELIGRLPEKDSLDVASALSVLMMKEVDSSSSMQNFSGLISLLNSGRVQATQLAQRNEVAAQQTPESLEESESQAASKRIPGVEDASYQIRKFLGSFVPSTVADVAHGIDPINRQVRTVLDEYKSRIPGLSKDLPPQVDLFGQPVSTPLGWNRLTGNLVSLFRTTDIKHDPVIDEIAKLNPPLPDIGGDGTLTIGEHGMLERIPATPEQIHRAQVLRGTLQDPNHGNLHKALEDLMANPEYKQMQPADKSKWIQRIATVYTHMAVAAMAWGNKRLGVQPDMDLQNKYMEARQMRMRAAQSTKVAANLGAP